MVKVTTNLNRLKYYVASGKLDILSMTEMNTDCFILRAVHVGYGLTGWFQAIFSIIVINTYTCSRYSRDTIVFLWTHFFYFLLFIHLVFQCILNLDVLKQ